MNRTREQWAALKPDAFLSGSIAQARNVIEMMQQDIAELAAAVEALEEVLAAIKSADVQNYLVDLAVEKSEAAMSLAKGG